MSSLCQVSELYLRRVSVQRPAYAPATRSAVKFSKIKHPMTAIGLSEYGLTVSHRPGMVKWSRPRIHTLTLGDNRTARLIERSVRFMFGS